MASQLSDLFELVDCLRECALRGDWKSAGELAATLRQQTLPAGKEDLGEYLDRLKEALIVAKVSRAHSAATLVRLNAVSGFNKTRLDVAPPRQDFGESVNF